MAHGEAARHVARRLGDCGVAIVAWHTGSCVQYQLEEVWMRENPIAEHELYKVAR